MQAWKFSPAFLLRSSLDMHPNSILFMQLASGKQTLTNCMSLKISLGVFRMQLIFTWYVFVARLICSFCDWIFTKPEVALSSVLKAQKQFLSTTVITLSLQVAKCSTYSKCQQVSFNHVFIPSQIFLSAEKHCSRVLPLCHRLRVANRSQSSPRADF